MEQDQRKEVEKLDPSGETTVTLLFASPSYGPIDTAAVRSQRAAIMHAQNHGNVRWAGDVSPDRMHFVAARNQVVKDALELDQDEPGTIDAVLWVDSDIVLPPDAISRLADGLRRGADFVTGVYVQRGGEHYPLIAHFDEDRDSFAWFIGIPPASFAPVDGCGFGICLTSIELLKDLTLRHKVPFEWAKFSEDLTFCRRAKLAGYQLYVDTAVLCGHLMDPRPATLDTFIAKQSEVHSAPAKG